MLKFAFWISGAILIYSYVGYGLLLFFWQKIWGSLPESKDKSPPFDSDAFDVHFIVCAFNEENWIVSKLENSIAQAQTSFPVRFWLVTDGSDDATPDLVRRFQADHGVDLHLMHQPQRRGKIAAFQRAMRRIIAESESSRKMQIVVSTDANTMLNQEASARLIRHFADPRVGAVAGEKRIALTGKDAANSAGEGLYWKYESWLKKRDAELGTVVGAAGELFAFRLEAYEDAPEDTLIEDFYLTLRIAQKGWKVAYEPDAYAVEFSSVSVSEELKRKVRIAAGGLQAVWRLRALLNPFRYGMLTFQYVSHRVLRWTLAPLALPIAFLTNCLLAARGEILYTGILALQILFYCLAAAGWFFERRAVKIKAFFIPYYFCMMNYAVYAGLVRLMRGRQSVIWEKAARQTDLNG